MYRPYPLEVIDFMRIALFVILGFTELFDRVDMLDGDVLLSTKTIQPGALKTNFSCNDIILKKAYFKIS